MEILGDPAFLGRVMKIIGIDILLAGDNALVIALAVRTLDPRQQLYGRIWGTVGVSDNIIDASWEALRESVEFKLSLG
mgnify:CR=1 FL=1